MPIEYGGVDLIKMTGDLLFSTLTIRRNNRIDHASMFSHLGEYEDANAVGRMEEEALEELLPILISAGVPEDYASAAVKDEKWLGVYASIGQMFVGNKQDCQNSLDIV